MIQYSFLSGIYKKKQTSFGSPCTLRLFSCWLQQPGSCEWRLAETNRQRGNDWLLHNTPEMESTMRRQPVERNHRSLQHQSWQPTILLWNPCLSW